MLKFYFFFAILLFSIPVFSQTAPPTEDVQFWSDAQILFPLIKDTDKNGKEFDRLTVFFTGTFRAGGNFSRPVDERAGFGFGYRINKYVNVSPNYLYRAGQPYGNRREYEHRVRFDVSLEKKWKTFSISDRNRVEYRIRNSSRDSVRYRNKIQLKIPVTKDKKELFAPFVATEPFYDFRAKAWTRNEFSAGISKKLTSSASADFYYLLQSNRGNVLRTINAFGVNFKYRFD